MKRRFGHFFNPLLILGLLMLSFGPGFTFAAAAGSQTVTQPAQGSTSGFSAFHLLSETQGWVVYRNQLFWTSDGGGSWNLISRSIPGLSSIAAVDFIDQNEGRVLMVSSGSGDPVFNLALTHDGGATWVTGSLSLFSPGDINAVSSDIYMQWLDPQTGWLVIKRATGINFSIGSLFRTDDGGQTWVQLAIPIGEQVAFVTSQVGWVAGGAAGNELYRTGDGGVTWSSQAFVQNTGSASQQFAYFLPKFQDAMNGLLPVMTTDGNYARMDFYSTGDGGQSWSLDNSTPLDGNVDLSVKPPLAVFDAGHFFLAVPHSDRLVSQQGPQQVMTDYNQDGRSANLEQIDMASPSVGLGLYMAGGCYTLPSMATPQDAGSKGNLSCLQTTQLLKTDNGGETWSVLQFPGMAATTRSSLRSLAMMNPPVGVSAPALRLNNSYDVLTGQGVDICDIPTSSQLQAWWANSPYGAVNLYIGGVLRGCRNSLLNKTLVTQLFQQGWKFIPTWVGPQAPCTSFRVRISYDPTTAFNQGIAEADSATSAASGLGLTNLDGSNTIIYYDLEAYNTSNSSCRNAMKSFMNGWDQELAAKGNKSAVYGSVCSSGLTDFLSISHVPDAVWLAWWNYSTYNGSASVFNINCIANSYWANHQRLHQYAGDHNETWGGITINVDSNALDGPMAVPYAGGGSNAPNPPVNPKPVDNGILSRINDTWLYWSTNGSSCNLHLWGGNIDTNPAGNCASLHVGQLAPGAYFWQVSASNAYGTTIGPVWHFGIQPYAPTGLSIATVTSSEIDLGWTASSDDPANVDGYDVYFNNVDIGSLPKGTVSVSVSGLACNTGYSIFLRSNRQNIQSVNSNKVTTTTSDCAGGTPTTPPPTATPTPTSTTVPGGLGKYSPANNASGLDTSLSLVWGGASDASYYLYCYDTINNNTCDRYWTATYTTSAAINGLTAGQTYYWEVVAIKSSGAVYLDNGTWWNFSLTGGAPTSTAVASPTATPSISPTATPVYSPTATQVPSATQTTPTPSASPTAVPSSTPSGGPFSKIDPSNGSSGLPGSLTLDWNNLGGVLYYIYCLDTLNDNVCDTYWSSSAGSSATVGGLTSGVTYYWQVVAVRSNGSVPADNGVWWSFSVSGPGPTPTAVPPTATLLPTATPTVSSSTPTPSPTASQTGPPAVFSKLSPASGSTGNPTSLGLSWGVVSGASYYLYCYDTLINGNCDTFWTTSYQTSATLNGLNNGTTYSWQVLAIKPTGAIPADNGSWWSFTTGP